MLYGLKYAKAPLAGEEAAASTSSVDYSLGDSFNLRLLIHYIGDIHQPLHDTTMFSSDFPNGDRGGNSFTLLPTDGIKELHALWDSVVDKYPNDMDVPLSSDSWTTLGDISSALRGAHPASDFDDLDNSYKTWSSEGYQIAKDFVYANIQQDSWPSSDYITKGQAIADKQLAKGGYRLAAALVNMWGGLSTEVTQE